MPSSGDRWERGRMPGTAQQRRAVAALAGCALFAAVIRAPLFGLPLNSDEGGYAYVARQWAAGRILYGDAWVDRPQGLMLTFRTIAALSYSPTGIRTAAVIAGVVVTLAAGITAWTLTGARAAAPAALITAIVSAGPFIEGYEFNGELAATAVATTGGALAVWWWRRGGGPAGLVTAAVVCGAAPLMKQSAVDGVILVLAVALASPGRRLRHLLLAAGGAVLPLLAAAAQAGVSGWSRWWFAVVSFQSSLVGTVTLPERAAVLGRTLLAVGPDLGGLIAAAAIAAGLILTSRRELWPVIAWVAAAVVGAGAGAFAHPHYWVQAVAPLAVLTSTVISRCTTRQAVGLVTLAVVVPLITQAVLAVQSPARRVSLVFRDDRQRRADPAIAAWLRVHSAPSDQIYAFVAGGEMYLLTERDTGYPYLWAANVQHVPGAIGTLQDWLRGRSAPRWVIIYQRPLTIDPSGDLAEILDLRYRQVVSIQGFPVLELRR